LGSDFVPGQAAADQVVAENMTAESHNMPVSTPCPCQGPECRRAPHDHSPLHPSSPVRTTVSQELTALATRSFDLTLGDCWFIGEFSGLALRGHPLGVIRPPSI